MSYPGLPGNFTTGSSFTAAAENADEIAINALSAYSTQTANYTATVNDRYIAVDASAGPVTITLPSVSGIAGKNLIIEKVDPSVNPVTVSPHSGQKISGTTSQILVFQFHQISIESTGMNWLIEFTNYAGTQLGCAQLLWPLTFTNTTQTAAAGTRLSGLSITTIGTGRPVKVTFSGQGYGQTAGDFVAAQLLINGAIGTGANGGLATTFSLTNGVYGNMIFEASPVLVAGTSYTFEIGCWNQAGLAVMYADASTPAPINFIVEGQ